MLAHGHLQSGLIQQGTQFGQGLNGGQGNHHHAAGLESLQHRLKQRGPLLAAPADQHPVGPGQGQGEQVGRSRARICLEQLVRFRLQHCSRLHPQALGVGFDQTAAAAPLFNRQQLQTGPDPQGFQAHAAGASPQIPEHALRGQIEFGQQLDAHLPFGHQPRAIAVLQIQPIVDAEQR